MKYAFKDIASNCTEKRIPAEEDRLTYIGLEHLDSRKLAITRYGSDVPLKGEKLVMKKGDILFGKRNTYLKRVAIAPFDGLFSAHGMVLRPNEKVISKEFFPFFLSSDYFLNEAIRISVGSLSPTVNWKDLRDLEFEIPNFDKQHKLALFLSSANELKESYEKMIAATDEMVKSQFIEMSKRSCSKTRLGDLFCSIRNGANIKQGVNSGGYPITRIETIANGFVDRSKMGYAGIVDDTYSGYYLQDNDILMSHINSMKHIGKSAIYHHNGAEVVIHGMNLLCLRLKEDAANPIYVLYLLQSDSIRSEIRLISKQAVNQASFTVSDLKAIELTLPQIDIQNEFEIVVHQADKSKFELKQAIKKIDKVMRALMQ